MNNTLCPVPADEVVIRPLLQEFLENEVNEGALNPDQIFTVVLFGNEEYMEEGKKDAERCISNSDERIQVSFELEQLQVTILDERRLDTFATSLLYNLLELDQTADIGETIGRDDITNDAVRKIDYYIEKLNQHFATRLSKQSDRFEDELGKLFPVRLDDQNSSKLSDLFENQLPASENARVDYLLLASAASEEQDEFRQFFETSRDRDLDSKEHLSSGSGGGYTRVIQYGYDLRQDDFRPEFITAIRKAEKANTLALRNKLNRLSRRAELASVYTQEPELLRVISDQYGSYGANLADLLVRMINTIQVIDSNVDEIDAEYQRAKEFFTDEIDQLDSVYDRIQEHSSKYPNGKIQHDSSIVGDFQEFSRVADRISQPTAKFVLGYDREGRSSLYSTLEQNIRTRRQELESRERDLQDHTNRIQRMEKRIEAKVDNIGTAYKTIEDTSVVVELPNKNVLIEAVEKRCTNILDNVKSEVPGLGFSNNADDIRDTQERWDEMLLNARQDIDDVLAKIEQLEQFADDIGELEAKRDDRRSQLRTLREQMELDNE